MVCGSGMRPQNFVIFLSIVIYREKLLLAKVSVDLFITELPKVSGFYLTVSMGRVYCAIILFCYHPVCMKNMGAGIIESECMVQQCQFFC